MGELSELKGHLDTAGSGCGYVMVDCPNACKDSQKVMRKDLPNHLQVECEKRPYQCEHCGEKGTFTQITREHYERCPDFPLDCPNNCGVVQIKRSAMDTHCKKCPLEKVCCPFEAIGCRVVGLQRKDEAEHMEKNVVNHQLLMLKSSQKWDLRAAVIAKNVDSLLVSCTDEQRFALQSIRSVIDDSYCLKLGDTKLSLDIANFSKCKESNQAWYSPPFYLGDITGLKFRLAVYPNGIESGADTHVSLVIECLERNLKEPIEMVCGHYIHVEVTNSPYYIDTDDFCNQCQKFDEIRATEGGFYHQYEFMPHDQINCHNDTLRLEVQWMQNNVCDCLCHSSGSSSDYSDFFDDW